MKPLEIYIDGASKGNPGPAGIGVIICQEGEVLKNISEYIGENTNNFAEYSALIYALQAALVMKAEAICVKTDSELLCRQINRIYKVKSENIVNLFTQAMQLIAGFKKFSIQHVPREQNKGADKLADRAAKFAIKKKAV